jgi:MFS family permease
MQKVAVGWEIYERTSSAWHLGYVGLVQFLPLMVFAILAGHVTDTYNRKRVLAISLFVTAMASIGLAWNSATSGSVAVVYLCLGITGTAFAFLHPARAAFVPHIVPREIFSNAVSWNSSAFEMASMVGPAVGGLLIGLTNSVFWVYVLNAVMTLAYLALVSRISYRHLAEKNPISMRSLLAGLRYVWKAEVVFAAMTLDMFAVLLGGATSLMPIFARDILQVGPRGLGWMMTAPALGAFSMAMFQAHRPPVQKAGKALLLAVAGFGIVTIMFGISQSFAFSMVMLFLLGACDNISVVIRSTMVQLLTPDEMRGRVSALNTLFIGTSNELGSFESGVVAGLFGPIASVVSGGLGTLLVVLAVTWRFPALREYGALK